MKEWTYRRTLSRVGIAFCLLMLITQLAAAGLSAVVLHFAPQWTQQGWYLWALSQAPQYLLGVPVLLLVLRGAPCVPAPEKQRISAGRWLSYFAIAMAFTILGNLVSVAVTTGIGLLKPSGTVQNPIVSVAQAGNAWYNLWFGAILAPVMEELVFRKLLYAKIGQYGQKTYIWVGALLFGLYHGNLSQLIYAFLLGALMCYIYSKTGAIHNTILLHMALNFYGIVLAPWALQNETILNVLAVCIYAVVIIGVVLLIRLPKQVVLQPGSILPPVHPVRETLRAPGMVFFIVLSLTLITLVTLL